MKARFSVLRVRGMQLLLDLGGGVGLSLVRAAWSPRLLLSQLQAECRRVKGQVG